VGVARRWNEAGGTGWKLISAGLLVVHMGTVYSRSPCVLVVYSRHWHPSRTQLLVRTLLCLLGSFGEAGSGLACLLLGQWGLPRPSPSVFALSLTIGGGLIRGACPRTLLAYTALLPHVLTIPPPRHPSPHTQGMAGETGPPDRWSSLLEKVVGGPPLSSEAAAAAAFAFMNSSKRRRIATKWTWAEDERVQELVKQHGTRSWTLISRQLPGRNPKQVSLLPCVCVICRPHPLYLNAAPVKGARRVQRALRLYYTALSKHSRPIVSHVGSVFGGLLAALLPHAWWSSFKLKLQSTLHLDCPSPGTLLNAHATTS
jgi:hypothetical protein